jgi:hypothetical protein
MAYNGDERRQERLIGHSEIEEAVSCAVKKVFAILGVDIDKPESVEAFREDLRFGRRMRKAADHSFLAFVGMLTVGVVSAMWFGLQQYVQSGK